MRTKCIVILLFMLLTASCRDDDWTSKNQSTIRIFVNPPELTRVSFSESDAVTYASWEEGDRIDLFTERQGRLVYRVGKNDGGTIELLPSGDGLVAEDGDTVYACFNEFDNNHYRPEADKTQVAIDYANSTLDACFLYAKGQVSSGSLYLSFKHLYAYIKLTLTTDAFISGEIPDNISTITLSGGGKDTLQVTGSFDLVTEKLTIKEAATSVHCVVDNDTEELAKPETITRYIAVLPQPAGTSLKVSYQLKGEGRVKELFSRPVPKSGLQAGHIYSLNTGSDKMLQELEQQRVALEALYRATDGDHWINNTNWLSEKPIHEWYGVNNNEWGGVWESPYVVKLNLRDNNLCGTLPEEFVTLMNTASDIDMGGNVLGGVIPESIRTHEKWNTFGWNILQQNIYYGGRFDMTDIKLRADDIMVEYLEGGTTTLYSLLSRNKVSHIMIDTPNDDWANRHLSYHNKGYGTIIFHSGATGETREDTYERVKKYPIKDMIRLWGYAGEQLNVGLSSLGSTYLLDDKGYVIDYLTKDWDIPEEFYTAIIDSILYARLGEPEEHPIFSSEYYISTDYSRDGEVVTLQQATVGKGIDLVFMGDAYVDRDMENGGKYEEDMKESMEYFFSIEPYKSFRNRFNVYAVKVVSGTEYLSNKLDKMQLRLGAFNETGTDYVADDNLCFEYAGKVEGMDLDKVTIVNVVNNPNLFRVSGFTNMYDSGSSVAHVHIGGPSEIIVHESGGHGFAKLLDEYLAGNGTATEADKISFDAEYTSRGWGANVDLTGSPTEIKWAHMLADPLYQSEVGIYEGAWMWASGAYRPSENSVMNNDYSWFNAPSREAIYKAVMQTSEGDGWTYEYEDFVDYDAINRNRTQSRSFAEENGCKIIHCPPTFVKGGWRDAVRREKNWNIITPLR